MPLCSFFNTTKKEPNSVLSVPQCSFLNHVATATQKTRIMKLEHIGIAVKNLEESNQLFKKLFGKQTNLLSAPRLGFLFKTINPSSSNRFISVTISLTSKAM